MFLMPMANVITRIIGKPSGTMATNMATAIRNCSAITWYIDSPVSLNQALTTCRSNSREALVTATYPRKRPSDSSLISRGVLGVVTSLIPDAIPPNIVFIPTRTTTAFALPLDVTVPMKAMFDCSCRMDDSSTGSVCL